jgi:hypothetical protein
MLSERLPPCKFVHVELFASPRLCLAFCLLSVSNVSPMYNSNFKTPCPQTCVCVRVRALTSPSVSNHQT